jgi:hypothetical protein
MSYAKIPKICPDYGLGFNDFNQACDNADALVELYDVRHGLESTPAGVDRNPWLRFGKHDDAAICRTLTRIQFTTTGGFTSFAPAVSGEGIVATQRLGDGYFQVDLQQGVGVFSIFVQVEATGAETRHITTYRYGSTAYLTLWTLSGGTFIAGDFDFSVFIWGSGA